MKTAKEVLDKIKWDAKEDAAKYVIAYKDFESLSEIKFTDIKKIDEGFMIVNINGKETNIPLHRIREIKKDGEIVWQRLSAA